MNYKEFINLQDIAWFKNGINYKEDSTGEKVRIINVTNLVSNDFIYDHTELSQVQLPFEKFKSYLLKENDLVISRSASPGEPILFKGKKPTIYSGFSILIRLINKDYLPLFILYYLNYYKRNIINVSDGTIFKNLNQQILKEIQIPKIKKTQQGAISKILLDLDNKIELNNKINNNLEELAQTLYKHWFVDFEFPNEEGLPYKSSGGKMVESELGLIPEGWNIEPLGNSKISKLVTSGINEFNNEKIYLATADVTDTTITNRNTTITMKDKPSRANMQPRENTLWFAKMKNSRKLIRVSKNSTELISDYIFSTGFAGLYVKEYLNFVWTFLLTSSFDENKNGLASGTTQEAINNRNINKINLIVPKDRILNKFEEIFNDIYEKIEQNDNENQKLANLRDLLLPKLMSGEIRVPIKE